MATRALRYVQCATVSAALLGALVTGVRAQVPAGWAVAAYPSNRSAGCCAELGMIRVIEPTGGAVQSVQGLSVELTGRQPPPSTGAGEGVWGVLLRERDQALVCGKRVAAGSTLDLHVLQLSGLDVVSEQVVPIGTVAPFGGRVTPMFELAPDVILVSLTLFDAGLSGQTSLEATVDLSTGQVVFLPLRIVAIDASRTGDELYVAVPASSGGVQIYAVARSSGAVRAVLRARAFSDLVAHPNGRFYVTDFGTVREIDPSTGATRQIGAFSNVTGEIAFEPATGELLVTEASFGFSAGRLERLSVGGAQSTVARVDVIGLALRANPRPYGGDTPAAHRYRWTPWQPAVGWPRIGSAHALQVTAFPAGSAASLLLFSSAAGSAVVAGLQLNLDPTGLIVLGRVPASGRLPLPIPNESTLVGLTAYFQTIHADAGGLGASDGLAVTIMP